MKFSKASSLIFKALGISRHQKSEKTRDCSIEVLRSIEKEIPQDTEQSHSPEIMEAKIQLSYHSKNKEMFDINTQESENAFQKKQTEFSPL